jgi:hypothetical protein
MPDRAPRCFGKPGASARQGILPLGLLDKRLFPVFPKLVHFSPQTIKIRENHGLSDSAFRTEYHESTALGCDAACNMGKVQEQRHLGDIHLSEIFFVPGQV